ncbi:hypothetical protein NBRC116601_15320 [Cognatishimia sp. WU-CL00825]|uniref:DUF6455 family protein n=1 Tax=Cognatishimia sp. WU-CL00825 TaxID=3127658 RepID=UPI0031093B86
MPERATIKKHTYLFDTMAEKLGHDMQKHVQDHDISMSEVADAVLRCANCSNPDNCANNLAAQKSLQNPPSYCQNIPLFQEL